jgi:hypothetical protein
MAEATVERFAAAFTGPVGRDRSAGAGPLSRWDVHRDPSLPGRTAPAARQAPTLTRLPSDPEASMPTGLRPTEWYRKPAFAIRSME